MPEVVLSCGMPPRRDSVELARAAEDTGYARFYCCDSPALYGDLWIALARVAEGCARIGIGTAVSVPSLRHPLLTSSAIARLEKAQAAGANEIVYMPAGPDIPRELRAFARAAKR